MPYIIDGHNLIPNISALSLQAIDDEDELIKILREFCRLNRKKADIYFDNAPAGQPRTRKFGFVTAHFIRRGTTADAAIRTRLRKLGRAARNWTVVSSDREVAVAAREMQAQVISSPEFARLLSTSPETSGGIETDENLVLNDEAVNEWLELFQGDNPKYDK
jgi:uncharacterized protein